MGLSVPVCYSAPTSDSICEYYIFFNWAKQADNLLASRYVKSPPFKLESADKLPFPVFTKVSREVSKMSCSSSSNNESEVTQALLASLEEKTGFGYQCNIFNVDILIF